MPSKPIPGSTGEVLTCLPSAYLPHAGTGLLHLPRFLAKCRYVQQHGALQREGHILGGERVAAGELEAGFNSKV